MFFSIDCAQAMLTQHNMADTLKFLITTFRICMIHLEQELQIFAVHVRLSREPCKDSGQCCDEVVV